MRSNVSRALEEQSNSEYLTNAGSNLRLTHVPPHLILRDWIEVVLACAFSKQHTRINYLSIWKGSFVVDQSQSITSNEVHAV